MKTLKEKVKAEIESYENLKEKVKAEIESYEKENLKERIEDHKRLAKYYEELLEKEEKQESCTHIWNESVAKTLTTNSLPNLNNYYFSRTCKICGKEEKTKNCMMVPIWKEKKDEK